MTWTGGQAYLGTVMAKDAVTGKYRIEYDDGDICWEAIPGDGIKVLLGCGEDEEAKEENEEEGVDAELTDELSSSELVGLETLVSTSHAWSASGAWTVKQLASYCLALRAHDKDDCDRIADCVDGKSPRDVRRFNYNWTAWQRVSMEQWLKQFSQAVDANDDDDASKQPAEHEARSTPERVNMAGCTAAEEQPESDAEDAVTPTSIVSAADRSSVLPSPAPVDQCAVCEEPTDAVDVVSGVSKGASDCRQQEDSGAVDKAPPAIVIDATTDSTLATDEVFARVLQANFNADRRQPHQRVSRASSRSSSREVQLGGDSESMAHTTLPQNPVASPGQGLWGARIGAEIYEAKRWPTPAADMRRSFLTAGDDLVANRKPDHDQPNRRVCTPPMMPIQPCNTRRSSSSWPSTQSHRSRLPSSSRTTRSSLATPPSITPTARSWLPCEHLPSGDGSCSKCAVAKRLQLKLHGNSSDAMDGYPDGENKEIVREEVLNGDTPTTLAAALDDFDVDEFIQINSKRFPSLQRHTWLRAGTGPLWVPRPQKESKKHSDSLNEDTPSSDTPCGKRFQCAIGLEQHTRALTGEPPHGNSSDAMDGYSDGENKEIVREEVLNGDTPTTLAAARGDFDVDEFIRINSKRFPSLQRHTWLRAGTGPLWVPRPQKESKKRRSSSTAEPELERFGGMFTTLLGLYPRKRLKNFSTGKLMFTTEMANAAAAEVSSPNPRVASLKDWHERFCDARKLNSQWRAKKQAKAKYREKVRAKRETKRVSAAVQSQLPVGQHHVLPLTQTYQKLLPVPSVQDTVTLDTRPPDGAPGRVVPTASQDQLWKSCVAHYGNGNGFTGFTGFGGVENGSFAGVWPHPFGAHYGFSNGFAGFGGVACSTFAGASPQPVHVAVQSGMTTAAVQLTQPQYVQQQQALPQQAQPHPTMIVQGQHQSQDQQQPQHQQQGPRRPAHEQCQAALM